MTDLALPQHPGYHRAWFTPEFFDHAEINGYTVAVDSFNRFIARQVPPARPGAETVYAYLFERPLTWSAPSAAPHGLYLVATVPDGVSVIALTVWKDRVVLATTTGVYIMADQATGFVPMKMTYEDKPDA